MKLEISEEGARTLVEVPEGASTVGGADSDRGKVKGAPARLFTLGVEGGTVHLGDRAWLRHPGDARLEVPRSGAETVAVARELLGALEAPPSRAGALQCLTGMDLGRTFPLADGPTELGRGETAA